ncbi:uncharacterized protein EV422DRAFT_542478 [Fimicolochytrium jonesii]|uniref:uncharacterized protein n=1 Tax=Fimicolochytrium jonesii TaxID=1396493 RepID=UPI0022FE96E7|nr:uncharacterized protein EV422DRAFT_542478 [Fimicolochytrium jonesii]KAI8817115.1 hypothetical protein EV422DRAFT_542478 [Fimicolochytrium jonesii]
MSIDKHDIAQASGSAGECEARPGSLSPSPELQQQSPVGISNADTIGTNPSDPATGSPSGSSPSAPSKKTKKKPPPKPGSKAYLALKKSVQSEPASATPDPFTPPTISHCPTQNVLILSFTRPSDLTAALGRPHVAYEGGHLKGPLKGVNFPVDFLRRWVEGLGADRVTAEEAWMLALVKGSGVPVDFGELPDGPSAPPPPPPSPQSLGIRTPVRYICAYLRNDRSTLLHEWAHAMFFTSPSYRDACEQLYKDVLDDKARAAVGVELRMRNYKEEVYMDEWQAYCVEGPTEFGKKWSRVMKEPHVVLRKLVGAPPGW